ncbi:DUF4192 domain-containing protein [Saccharothrix violaceirubra]|uniref:DUF4192 domain-containing protein n=1 Tax=Saccharothrix violaceirubra TaxID=413306 RepID=A0A7W7T6T3_9PSEU|nr:DUF4192 domain-containing protein [Saccharothrix violaceirubra]MBB4967634.1 hypothetical protein [Saccharothrix violaceirubra]
MDHTRLDGPGDVIAAVPHLLGFHPSDSIVLLALEDSRVHATIRTDLGEPRHDPALAHRLVGPVARFGVDSALAVVVGGCGADPPERLPRDSLIGHLTHLLTHVDVTLSHALWTRSTHDDQPWFDYHDRGTAGRVPDPRSSAFAAESAVRGHVTYRARAELATLLAPDPQDALTRRARLLDEYTRLRDPDTRARDHDLVRAEIVRAADRTRPLTDEEVADLAYALSDPYVRDGALAHAVGPHARGAELLWTELTRATPIPERAEPATLLAVSAYLRGEGALANVALDQATTADPTHRLATLVGLALEAGMSPLELRSLAENAGDRHPPP